MKILYVTTIGITMTFFKSFIEVLLEDGHEVEIATNSDIAPVPKWYSERDFKVHTISCSRSPMDRRNILAIRQIKKLVEENGYDIVHCHTPVAAACTRIACREARKRGTRVFYTAHGFHFYKGAPLKNWLIFYPIERICSYWTDVLITINEEDYGLAKRFGAKKFAYVPGVGIDTKRFADITVDRAVKRKELSIPNDVVLLLSVGELNRNKNHEIVMRAMAQIDNDKIHYAIAGDGELYDYLTKLSEELGLRRRVHLLGYRKDVAELYKVADVFMHPSFREGLPVSVMEAMASGLPCVVSDIRGNRDLVKLDGMGRFNPKDVYSAAGAIMKLLNSDMKIGGEENSREAKKYDTVTINRQMVEIYQARI